MSDNIPEDWVPYDTLLCRTGEDGNPLLLYMGIAPLSMDPFGAGKFIKMNEGKPVQIVMYAGSGSFSWCEGTWLRENYHIYRPGHCAPPEPR
jgi:hypothetical protein